MRKRHTKNDLPASSTVSFPHIKHTTDHRGGDITSDGHVMYRPVMTSYIEVALLLNPASAAYTDAQGVCTLRFVPSSGQNPNHLYREKSIKIPRFGSLFLFGI